MSKVSDPFLCSHCHLNVDPALFLVLFSWMLTLCVPFNDMVIPSSPSHVLSRSIYVMWEKNVHHCVCVWGCRPLTNTTPRETCFGVAWWERLAVDLDEKCVWKRLTGCNERSRLGWSDQIRRSGLSLPVNAVIFIFCMSSVVVLNGLGGTLIDCEKEHIRTFQTWIVLTFVILAGGWTGCLNPDSRAFGWAVQNQHLK